MDRTFRPYRSRTEIVSEFRELRSQMETARLDLRALFRSLDRRRLLQSLPKELGALMELDADLAEAQWVLDQPRGRFDLETMRRDTMASIATIPVARERLLALLEPAARAELGACIAVVRPSLAAADAYTDVPGRNPPGA